MKILAVTGYVFLGCQMAMASNEDLVISALNAGDFLPHVLLEKQVVQQIGSGLMKKNGSSTERIYAADNCNTWLRLVVDNDPSPEYRTIQEITASKLRLSDKSSTYRGKLCGVQLRGISLGDDIGVVYAKFHEERIDTKASTFNGIASVEAVIFPKKGDGEIFYKFYSVDKKIVGFSLGITE